MSGSDASGKETENRDTVARLVSLAGARTKPGTSIEASVRVLVEKEWLAAVRRQRRQFRIWVAACGIGAALALAWTGLYFRRDVSPELIGTLVGTRGHVQLTPAVRPLNASGDALFAGEHLATGQGAAALLSVGSIGIRLGPQSELVLQSATTVRLVAGRVYIDSGEGVTGGEVAVETQFGTLRHRGTQFQAQVQPGQSLLAMVREGQVDVRAYGHNVSLGAGEELRVTDAGTLSIEKVPTYGELWDWTSAYVPEVSVEGRSLSSFLTWFARETGRSLRYSTPELQADAERTRLSGSVKGLTPDQALEAILAATGFQIEMTASGEIRVVSRNRAPAAAKMEPHAAVVSPGGSL
jgi:hypothetical protein